MAFIAGSLLQGLFIIFIMPMANEKPAKKRALDKMNCYEQLIILGERGYVKMGFFFGTIVAQFRK